MSMHHNKTTILVEALPYIREFAGKIIVIKYGGAAMAAANLQEAVMQDIALMKFCGMYPIVVHGGGPEINSLCEKMGITPKFIDGLRVTDAATMELVQMTLVGKTNRNIVTRLNQHGVRAIGLSGQDGQLLHASKRLHQRIGSGETVDLGFVGDVDQVNITVLETLLHGNFVPVIAPIGVDTNGQSYNINADTAAGAIAAALRAEKLVFLTDVEGIRADKNDPNSLVSHITVDQAKDWILNGKLEGGMIPKLNACFAALQAGTQRVHIIDGRVQHSLLLEVFTDHGVGTMVMS